MALLEKVEEGVLLSLGRVLLSLTSSLSLSVTSSEPQLEAFSGDPDPDPDRAPRPSGVAGGSVTPPVVGGRKSTPVGEAQPPRPPGGDQTDGAGANPGAAETP